MISLTSWGMLAAFAASGISASIEWVEMKQVLSKAIAFLLSLVPGRWAMHRAGHFYSPIPSISGIRRREAEVFRVPREIPGVELRETEQLVFVRQLEHYYREIPFGPDKSPGTRYYFENRNFSYADAIFLFCLIRHVRPRRIIEVGSGHSSCVILDANELFFDNAIDCTFIEPFPKLLRSLVKKSDLGRVKIIDQSLQEVGTEAFSKLEAGDILFIDSTHVSKVDSDVNHIFFRILPALKRGVYVHLHDIFYPFEYPQEWIYSGRAWNENYVLRAFLQYNSEFEIVLFNNFLFRYHENFFSEKMPLCMKNTGGSIWLVRK